MTIPGLRLSVHQFAPRLGDVEANASRIASAAGETGSGLLLTPELSLTGYELGDDASPIACEANAPLPQALRQIRGVDVVVGRVERDRGGRLHNVAVIARADGLLFRHRKIYLPTYGMFDEGRFFAAGDAARCWASDTGWRVGVLICEDFWHPGLAYLLAGGGADLILVQAAAPGRGVWEGAAGGGRFASADSWERIARTTAELYGVYLALANRTGVEGGATFAGGSLIVGPTGDILARAPDHGESLLTAELEMEEVRRARQPYAHARDENLRLMSAELGRIIDEREP